MIYPNLVADHRCFINNKQGVIEQVIGQRKSLVHIYRRFFTIDALVYGKGLPARICRYYLGCATGWRKQHVFEIITAQCLYQRAKYCCFTGTRITFQYKAFVAVIARQKAVQLFKQHQLLFGRFVRKSLLNVVCQVLAV